MPRQRCAGRGRSVRLALVGLTVLTSPLSAQDADSPSARQRADSLSAPSAGGLFRASDLIYAGLLAGSLLTAYVKPGLDESVLPDEPADGFWGVVEETGAVLGNGALVFGGVLATWAVGEISGSEQVARIGLRSLEALVLSTAIVVPTKVIVGRARPDHRDVADEFDSFSFTSAYWSLPSGHAAAAFAVASTLDRELRHQAPWVPYLVYPTAAFVGVSRVMGRKHWLTDVVAGSAIGLFSGHFIGRLHGEESIGLRATPVVAAGAGTLVVGASVRLR